MRDWTKDASIRNTNLRSSEAEKNDYYATEPRAVELLLECEEFSPYVWEPACGEGHISEVLKINGYKVRSTDLIDRGYGQGGVDFFKVAKEDLRDIPSADIITNPPYKCAKEFVEHALDISPFGTKIAMFLKLTFLESRKRLELFKKYPPKTVYISSGRLQCGKNGQFNTSKDAVAYAWFIWEKGFVGEPTIRWFN